MPVLQQWSTTHLSLREIGVDDVRAVLPADPLDRYTTRQGLRSIFRILKPRKLAFVNPTARLQAPQPQAPTPLRSTSMCCAWTSTLPSPPPPRWPCFSPSTLSASASSATCA
jgi:hypothetical protein